MDNEKQLRVSGVPQPKGVAWLHEVKVDAARNAIENLRSQAEKKEFEEAKARGVTPEDIIRKGKEDLVRVDPETYGEFALKEDHAAEDFGDEGFEEEKPKKPLQQMNKAELQELAEKEGVEVPEGAKNADLVAAIQEKRKETN